MVLAYLMSIILVMPILMLQEYLSKENDSKKRRYIVLGAYTFMVFIVVTGLRDTASISLEHFRQSDELNYRRAFELLSGTSFDLSNIVSFEWGRYLLDWTLANVFQDSQTWVFTYAFLTNLFFVKSIMKYVRPFWLGIYLFITAGVFTFQMNGTTSVLASAILLLGIEYIILRKFWKYLLVVLIAGGIHFSALIMLPLYFIVTKRIFTRWTLVWVFISVGFMIWFDNIANFILPNTPYAYYLHQINSNELYGVSVVRVIIFSLIYLFILFSKKRIVPFTNTDRYFFNGVIILLTINLTSSVYVYVYRFNEIFVFSLIYMLPRVLSTYRGGTGFLLIFILIIAFLVFGIQQNWNSLYENILFK